MVSPCVIIPTYNSGPLLLETLHRALQQGFPVFVIVDGSTDGSDLSLPSPLPSNGHVGSSSSPPPLQVHRLPKNQGKGFALIKGMRIALQQGFTHALTLDADGQHTVEDIPAMFALCTQNPDAMILGSPIFGPDAPPERVFGHRIANWWTNLETLWAGIADSLFGLRIYPIPQSLELLSKTTRGRRYDFETVLAVHLCWSGVRPISFPTHVSYPPKAEGGLSHFHYLRDNLLLIQTHFFLVLGMLKRLPKRFKFRRSHPSFV